MSVALRGFYEACCVVVSGPIDEVQKMLDPRLVALDDRQTLAPPGQHPYVILMGAHRDVQLSFLPGKWNYREALVAIPWVRRKGEACGSDPLAYNEHLWLDRLPVVIGGWLWGFPKIWSRIKIAEARNGESYSVRTYLGDQVLNARFDNCGNAGKPEDFPNFAAVRPIFEQLFIQRFLLIGPAILSHLDFELQKATIQPIDATVEYKKSKFDVRGLDQTPLGGFRLSLPWTLSWPFTCATRNGQS